AFDGPTNSITISRVDKRSVAASLSVSTQGASAAKVGATGITFGLGGAPALGEVWTLTLDGIAHAYTAKFRDDLSTIASQLASMIPLTTYDLAVEGRVIAIDRVDGTTAAA